jgi:hypothetical protein
MSTKKGIGQNILREMKEDFHEEIPVPKIKELLNEVKTKMSKEENRNLTKTTEEILQRHAEFAQRHAIEFAEFVSNDSVFDDFWSMSKEHQENIYQEFINQNKYE